VVGLIFGFHLITVLSFGKGARGHRERHIAFCESRIDTFLRVYELNGLGSANSQIGTLSGELSERGKKRLRFRDLGQFRRRREALHRAGQDVIGLEGTAGRMIQLRQR